MHVDQGSAATAARAEALTRGWNGLCRLEDVVSNIINQTHQRPILEITQEYQRLQNEIRDVYNAEDRAVLEMARETVRVQLQAAHEAAMNDRARARAAAREAARAATAREATAREATAREATASAASAEAALDESEGDDSN